MTFVKRKIGNQSRLKRLKKDKKQTHSKAIFIGSCILTLSLLFWGAQTLISSIDLKGFIFSFGANLQKDYNNNTNFLLMGTGGAGHDGGDLTDSIIIGSLNHKTNKVTLLSVPRDLYIEDEKLGNHRINQLYELGKIKYGSEEGLKMATKTAEEISGLTIHYYAKIDFGGFKKIVDSLGGVEVNVRESIYDPYYPKEGTIEYTTFHIKKGLQTIDGDTALKYARSRKTTSDFDRSRRQQDILFAIKKKAMNKEILSDPAKIKDLFFAVKDTIETNISVREIIEFARIATEIDRESISTHVLSNEPSKCGGFLYTPERKYYGGAFVLLPITDSYTLIHKFMDQILARDPQEENQIQILNGTKTAGVAGKAKMKLTRNCFDVIRYGNARSQDITETTIYYKGEEEPEIIKEITSFIPAVQISNEVPIDYLNAPYVSNANIIVEIGKDYTLNQDEDPFEEWIISLNYMASQAAKGAETSSEEN